MQNQERIREGLQGTGGWVRGGRHMGGQESFDLVSKSEETDDAASEEREFLLDGHRSTGLDSHALKRKSMN